MNERIELLIQLELDGEINAAEREELDAASETDPATRAYRSQMADLGQDLERDLLQVALEAVRGRRPARQPQLAAALRAGDERVVVALGRAQGLAHRSEHRQVEARELEARQELLELELL